MRTSTICENIRDIRENIEAAAIKSGRTAEDITLIAVTKTVPAERISEALACGIFEIGENKVQELLDKYDTLSGQGAVFHLIGHLQTNKVKYIIDKAALIHSVDSARLAREIDRRAGMAGITAQVLIEVNIGGELSKSGVGAGELPEFLNVMASCEHIRVRGLMAIPPYFDDPEKTRPFFQRMYQLFVDNKAKKTDNISMDFLSMGMSGDYAVAIEEGANMVRIGTSIFGQRKYVV